MRADLVVVLSPGFCPLASIVDIQKCMSVQQLVANTAIKGFDLSVLRGFPGLDEL